MKPSLLVVPFLVLSLNGCAATIAKKECANLGYTDQEQINCAERLVRGYYNSKQPSSWQQYVPQQSNHGARGCTPNFSTGGCL